MATNIVLLTGRLTADPELKHTASGTPVSRFTIAVDRPKDKDGSHEADFIDIVTWNKVAETCCQHLGKGRLVLVNGRIRTRNYEDKNGNKRKAVEVVAFSVQFLDWPKKDTQPTESSIDEELPPEFDWPAEPPF